MAERINWDKLDPSDPRFYKLDPNNPNVNISASRFDPTDPTAGAGSVGAKYNEFLTTANIGDTFDWGGGIKTQFTGFNQMGTPMIQTIESEGRKNWREGLNPSKSLSDNLKILMDKGFSKQEATFMLAGEFDPQWVASKMGISSTSGSWAGSGTTGSPLTLNGNPFTGNYNGSQYNNGILVSANNNNQGANYSGSGVIGSPLVLNGSPYNGILGGVSYTNGIAQKTGLTQEDIETKSRRTAQQDFKAALGELGLADLADEVDRMIKEDFTVSQIKMELPKSASYQLRFPGMKALRDAGRAISEATYISNEKGYQQTLRAYGLDTAVFGSRSEMGKYIALEVSPREFEERVNLASTRVKDNPDVMNTFKSYFPEVDESGVVSYLLNPTKGMDIIKKQVRTTEIGAAATKAGFANQVNAAYAGTLIGAVGESTYAQISNEFQRARQLANSQRRLAEIEGQAYSDLEAVSAVVGDDVTSALASERRAAREVARFGTRGGISGTSLGTTAQI